MEEAIFIEKLLSFGLGRQEASIYLCLIKNGELTGYEVAKLTGISRSNVYNALAALTEHGAAYIIEGASTKYTAVPIEEFCDNRIRYLSELKGELVQNCPQHVLPSEGYITIDGNKHICDKIHNMMQNAEQRIYISASSAFLAQWGDEITGLLARDIKVVLISDVFPDNMEDIPYRERIIFFQSLSGDEEENCMGDRSKQIRLIIDSAYVLTGEYEGKSSDTCLYSAQKNFVNVFKEAMHNEIRLIQLSNDK